MNDPLLARMLGEAGLSTADIAPQSRAGRFLREDGVEDTGELRRVVNLPARDWTTGLGGEFGTTEQLIALLTREYAREGGQQTLRGQQAVALAELFDFGGGIAAIRVGGGKTLVTFLAPAVVKATRPLLFVPAALREKTAQEWLECQRHWILPEIRTESYEFFGRTNSDHFLDNYAPDLLILDEGHRVKNTRAAVTKRIGAYIKKCREQGTTLRVLILSGTITRKSIKEYWHLLRWTLGDERMPLPNRFDEVMQWASCLDVSAPSTMRVAPGALERLCNDEEKKELLLGTEAALTATRKAYQRRLVSTPGVISTLDSRVSCSLRIDEIDVDVEHLAPFFTQLRVSYETPDGHPFEEAVDLWRHARELACGFYQRWNPRPPKDWLLARKRWSKFIRTTLRDYSHRFFSPKHVTDAVLRGEIKTTMEWLDPETLRTSVHETWPEWVAVRDAFRPNEEAVWIDDTVLKVAAGWLKRNDGIVWVEHRAFGERLEEMTGVPYFRGHGLDKRGNSLLHHRGPMISSIKANSQGHNLQRYSSNLIVSMEPSATTWEQTMGRSHRDGQEADEVVVEAIFACKEQLEGFWSAVEQAKYVHESTGQLQKLLYADVNVVKQSPRTSALWR